MDLFQKHLDIAGAWKGAKELGTQIPFTVGSYRANLGVSKHILVDAFSAKTRLQMPGSMVDFIYIFPQGRDHYGLVPPGFVIRPNGDTWSKDWGGGWLVELLKMA